MKSLEKRRKRVRQVRLSIILPALLLLFTIGVGLSNYQIAQFFLETSGNRYVQQVLEETSRYILFSSLVITFLALLVGVVITLAIIKPLKRMTESVSLVAQGNLPPKLDVSITDEMRQLSSSFNQVIDYLQELFEERDRYILENESGGIILLDNAGKIKALNIDAEKFLKVLAENAIGKSFSDLRRTRDPFLIDALIRIMENNQESEIIRWTTTGGKRNAMIASMSKFKEGKSDAEDSVIHLRDISTLESFYEGLQRADVLAAIGALSTGVAHEIRNPLASIKSLSQLLTQRIDDTEKVKEYLDIMNEEIKRIDQVVSAIMEMADPRADPYERCDINRLLAEALIKVQRGKSAPTLRTIKIVEDYSLLPYVLLPPGNLIRAFYNILENAVEATDANGTIRIKTSLQNHSPEEEARIRIIISNTGSSVPESDKDRIFQPFFTTKPQGKGLGLSIAYQIIIYNCGTIRVESANNETAFIIEFPLEKIITSEQD